MNNQSLKYIFMHLKTKTIRLVNQTLFEDVI